ncbi:MAG: hypothetical protein A2934_03410 [Candidatus Sungbacteria bacterium RIFCSPLOWO2_01_FULL_47_10]|uniref:Uncharacterized protein n=1 Tax=Candidatus Sungbacteria bacterium RIFCSPLOWO2_01_FULL_47_10 TaxID=1802276 RepID=A0A1G2L6M4_9BACT|nr:MAG: hypothetical protein A2934_03410 [Candidatus Sungbacteria bacterium RIFCSPLOWO2_01_FULL_47_10]
MQKGISAIELLVVTSIIVVTTAIALFSFPNFRGKVQIERSARDLSLTLRTAQQNTLSPKQVTRPDGSTFIPTGFGVNFNTAPGANISYIFFADSNGDGVFDVGGGDVIIETVSLPSQIIIEELKVSSGQTFAELNIVYTVPFSETKIYTPAGLPVPGETLQIKMSQGAGSDIARFVTVRTTGLITLGPVAQITAESVIVGGVPGTECPGTNINQADRWAWNDILGWIDFCGGISGRVIVRDDRIIGYATSSSAQPGSPQFDAFGALALDCSTTPASPPNQCAASQYGVKNDGSGVLSGWAWLGGNTDTTASAAYGWVSFNCSNTNSCATSPYQVTIDENGDFHGDAWKDIVGWVAFNCEDTGSCTTPPWKVNTLWRPDFSILNVDVRANGAQALTIPFDTSALLTWSSRNLTIPDGCEAVATPANNCWNSLLPASGTTTQNTYPGTACSNLTQTTTFNITCETGQASDFVTVTVLSATAVDMKADDQLAESDPGPILIPLNTSANLTWGSSSTVSCVASGNWSGPKPLINYNGQPTGPQPTATTTTYYLDCLGADGTGVRDSVKVEWQ